MADANPSLHKMYDVVGGEGFSKVNVGLPGTFLENIGVLVTAGSRGLSQGIMRNLGMGMGGYGSVETMPTIHLRKDDGSEVPVPLWIYSSHYETPTVLEVFARAEDLEFVAERLSKELSKSRR